MLHPSDKGLDNTILIKGIQLHRRIDQFTDNHTHMVLCRTLLRPGTSKYAPVVMDIFLDFLLFDHWERYCNHPFSEFEHEVYAMLDENLEVLPVRLQTIVREMVDHRWLQTYTTASGRLDVFRRLGHRVSRPEMLKDVLNLYTQHYAVLEGHFSVFFPEMISLTEEITGRPNPWIIPQNGTKS